ncbi:MAG: hypothetical protein ISS31_09125 [Kiritimatiellae bacterium]|nr:hypothetical protein [bacterium]MBL7077622.1 hypothetical protein [Kiritimatiellia bacterium]
MSFCTAINCIDGRVQLPVIRYLQERWGTLYVDVVSEAGPVRSLSDSADSEARRSILRRVGTSIEAHRSRGVAVVAHADCAGNPVDDEQQRRELALSVDYIAESFPETPVLGLWVDAQSSVAEVCSRRGSLDTRG